MAKTTAGGREIVASRGGSSETVVRRDGRSESKLADRLGGGGDLDKLREVITIRGSAVPFEMDDAEIHRSVERLVAAAQIAGTTSGWVTTAIQGITNALKSREPVGSGLTEAEANYLVASGAFTPEQFAATEKRVSSGALALDELQTRTAVVTRALTTDETAHRLGLSSSRVRHRQAKNGLYSFLVGRSRLYPTWQFIGNTKTLLPHLTTVVTAFPEDWHAVSAESFMTTPQDSLIDDKGLRVTPIEWLLAGRDPQVIVKILNGVTQR